MSDARPEENPDDHLIAHDVDVEPTEPNRRMFTGWRLIFITAFAAIYAALHMAALNGLSISALTGVTLPLLPQFPMETWNFRIVHVAGALVLGFLLFNAFLYRDTPQRETPLTGRISLLLLIPAVLSLAAAIWFAILIQGGALWNGIDPTVRFREVWLFGLPLLLATAGGIALSWIDHSPRDRFGAPDLVLSVCAISVAAYLVTVFGTPMRMSTGSDFAPIGISFAATAGAALIMELTRRMAGMALVVIAGVFLSYVFLGDLMPGFLNAPPFSWQRFFSQVYTDA
ncbi:MAG: TRAP transporter permease, partial [Pseudomonadota bacterium]